MKTIHKVIQAPNLFLASKHLGNDLLFSNPVNRVEV